MNHRPVASPEKSDDAIMGTKTSNYSGHGLTLKQPRGLWAAMSNMGKVWPCRRTKEKKKKLKVVFVWGPWKYLGQVLPSTQLRLYSSNKFHS